MMRKMAKRWGAYQAGLLPLLGAAGCSLQVEEGIPNEAQSFEEATQEVEQVEAPLSANFVAAPGGLRRLSKTNYTRTIELLLGADAAAVAGAPNDPGEGQLSAVAGRTLSVDPSMINVWELSGFAVAQAAIDHPATLAEQVPCVSQGRADADFRKFCYTELAHRMGFLFWRLPPTEQTKTELIKVGLTAEQDGTTDAEKLQFGLKYMLAAILQSPSFLYNLELGKPGVSANRTLNPFEVASRLSLFLFGRGPTPELLDLAAEGGLNTAAQVRAYAVTALTSTAGRAGFDGIMTELWELQRLFTAGKTDPAFTADLVESMAHEVELLWQDVVFDRPRSYLDIYKTEERRIDSRLAAIYSVPAPANDWDLVDFATVAPAQERAGMFTTPAMMSIHSHPALNSPTRRGFTVRTHWLCGEIPPPPPGLDIELHPPGPGQTLRQSLSAHASGSCANCHVMMDNVGFTFEHFDNIGRYRTQDNGQPVDSTFLFTSPAGTAQWDGPRGFAAFVTSDANLAKLPNPTTIATLSRCTVNSLYRLSVGMIEDDADERTALEDLDAAFAASTYSMQGLLADIVSGPGFLQVGPLY